jgi:hypothetical protein
MPDPIRPSVLVRLDGAAAALVAVLLYRELGVSWWILLVAFLVPDLAFLGYLGGKRAGVAVYNLAHTYLWPAVLFAFGLVGEHTWAMAAGLIWLAHLGLDRALGFGLRES